jgi:hypothetical protein
LKRKGGTVATVGFPNIGLQGFAPKFARGEIASLSGAGADARYFQISVPVPPGNSGGALVDARGNAVGVVSAKLNAAAALSASGALPENVNYEVKTSYLLSFLESVPEVSEGFNIQKNSGLNLEHAYSTGVDTLKSFYYLLQIAHLFLQMLVRGSLLRQLARQYDSTPRVLFGSLKNIAQRLVDCFRYFHLEAEVFNPTKPFKFRLVDSY